MSAPSVADALLALASDDAPGAAELAAAAAGSRTERPGGVAAALARYLAGGDGAVYDDPSAFQRFVDGGGNVGLYAAAEAALRALHADLRPARVADLGCGDGRLAVCAAGPDLERLDLVEPSAELLAAALGRTTDAGLPALAHGTGALAFLAERAGDRWDVVQSTFALHTLEPVERADVLGRLASQAGRLVLVEFDVPAFEDRSAEHAAYAAARYEDGVGEYRDDVGVVQGFLMPVLVGQFAAGAPRHTYEQPVRRWCDDLAAAGFEGISHRALFDYWWAPAHLVEARGAASG